MTPLPPAPRPCLALVTTTRRAVCPSFWPDARSPDAAREHNTLSDDRRLMLMQCTSEGKFIVVGAGNL